MAILLRRCCHILSCMQTSHLPQMYGLLESSSINSKLQLSAATLNTTIRTISSKKGKYPELIETELEEKFTRGGGPGGQATNTTSNCVLLKHRPTGLVIKCHAERSLELNRKIARRRMQERLDDHYNGENSIIAQQKLRAKSQLLKRKAKTKKKLERLAVEKALIGESVADPIQSDDGSNVDDDKCMEKPSIYTERSQRSSALDQPDGSHSRDKSADQIDVVTDR